MILTFEGDNTEELYQRWLDLREVITAVLAQAENEMFFADFLWGDVSSVESLLETRILLDELRKLTTYLKLCWTKISTFFNEGFIEWGRGGVGDLSSLWADIYKEAAASQH